MAVYMGQALLLTLAVPAVCLLLFALTQLEQWLVRDEDSWLRRQRRTDAGEGGQAQPVAVGSISPPVIPADPEGRAARVAELTASVVKVAVYGRVSMSREVLDDLMRLLKLTADQYDAAVALARRPSAPQEG